MNLNVKTQKLDGHSNTPSRKLLNLLTNLIQTLLKDNIQSPLHTIRVTLGHWSIKLWECRYFNWTQISQMAN